MLWIKAFHIISVICWFAGLFYLPRLFVYHSLTEDQAGSERFKVMERKLYRGIMTPSLVMVIFFGGWLYQYNSTYYNQAGWMHAKLSCVALLIIYHAFCGHFLKQFRADSHRHSHKFFRLFNEIPVFLLFAVVILVIVKPF
jgi:putative membrane protein